MRRSKRNRFSRLLNNAKEVASQVTNNPNLAEVAGLIILLNEYASSKSDASWQKLKAAPMPTGFLHSKLIGTSKFHLNGQVFRTDGSPIEPWMIAQQAEAMCTCNPQKMDWLGVDFLPTADKGILQLSMRCSPAVEEG